VEEGQIVEESSNSKNMFNIGINNNENAKKKPNPFAMSDEKEPIFKSFTRFTA
jgi:hypothetical protein